MKAESIYWGHCVYVASGKSFYVIPLKTYCIFINSLNWSENMLQHYCTSKVQADIIPILNLKILSSNDSLMPFRVLILCAYVHQHAETVGKLLA